MAPGIQRGLQVLHGPEAMIVVQFVLQRLVQPFNLARGRGEASRVRCAVMPISRQSCRAPLLII